jgi:hypothetical protein
VYRLKQMLLQPLYDGIGEKEGEKGNEIFLVAVAPASPSRVGPKKPISTPPPTYGVRIVYGWCMVCLV